MSGWGPWRELSTEELIEVVAPGGEIRSKVGSYYSGNTFIIEDLAVDVRVGDESPSGIMCFSDRAFAASVGWMRDVGMRRLCGSSTPSLLPDGGTG